MKKATPRARRSKPTIRVANETHHKVSALRSEKTPTFGSVINQLLIERDTAKAEAASIVGITKTDPILAKRRNWFTSQETLAPELSALRSQELSGADLLEIAAKVAGVPLENLIRFAALQTAKQIVLDDMRAQANLSAANSTGVSYKKLEEAYAELVADKIPVTSSRLRERAGTNGIAAARWLLLHHPEHLT